MSKTFVNDVGLTIDFSDEVKLLTAEHLSKYKLLILIILRNASLYYGQGDPQNNAGWWSQGKAKIVSDPPLPKIERRHGNLGHA
jgi:hypothetical protein